MLNSGGAGANHEIIHLGAVSQGKQQVQRSRGRNLLATSVQGRERSEAGFTEPGEARGREGKGGGECASTETQVLFEVWEVVKDREWGR